MAELCAAVLGARLWRCCQSGPRHARSPDFAFPQLNPDLAPPGGARAFVDYLYLSLTNSIAFQSNGRDAGCMGKATHGGAVDHSHW